MTKKSARPAIIFLNPPHSESTNQLTTDITRFCKGNNLKVIKTIHTKGIYDTSSIHKLTRKIKNHVYKPITIIIDIELKFPVNIIQLCVLETLFSVGIAEIITFEKGENGLKFNFLGKGESDFLHCGAMHLRRMTATVSGK